MKSLVFLCLAMSWMVSSAATVISPTPSYHSVAQAAGSIVMEDAILMRATANPGNGTIVNIKIFDNAQQEVLQLNGCGSSECSINLSSLSNGTYLAKVVTDMGSTFSAFVNVG